MAKISYQLNGNIPEFKNFLGIVVILIIAFILNSRIENLQGGTTLSLSLCRVLFLMTVSIFQGPLNNQHLL